LHTEIIELLLKMLCNQGHGGYNVVIIKIYDILDGNLIRKILIIND